MKSSLVVWMLTLAVGLSVIVLSAAMGTPTTLLGVTGLVSLVFAILAIREDRSLRASGADRATVAASTARYMGLVWTWGALCLLIIYKFVLIEWKEWLHFFAMFAGVAVLCLFFGATLDRDSRTGKDDPTMVRLGRALTWAQLVGMGLTVVGLLIDKNKYLLPSPEIIGKHPDWAANIVFFFGALALAAISASSLLAGRGEGKAPAA